jgi:2-dehydropantoate 2-reductase
MSRAGHDVILVVRPESASAYPHSVHVESTIYGDFEADVRVTARLTESVDVLWITCKATQLNEALESVPLGSIGDPLVVPLLNGLDHIGILRKRFGDAAVVPAAIRTESTRGAAGHIVHNGWHVFQRDVGADMTPVEPIQLASDGPRRADVERLAAELRGAGIGCQLWADEGQVVWQKLAILAPYALATTAVGGSIGMVRADPQMLHHLRLASEEAVAVAGSNGVFLDHEGILATLDSFPDSMRVSMERDLASGGELEIANIVDPILRDGHSHGVPVPSTEWLKERALLRWSTRQ